VKISIFFYMTPCIVMDGYRRCRGAKSSIFTSPQDRGSIFCRHFIPKNSTASRHVQKDCNVKIRVVDVVLRYVVGWTAQRGKYSMPFSVTEPDQTIPLR